MIRAPMLGSLGQSFATVAVALALASCQPEPVDPNPPEPPKSLEHAEVAEVAEIVRTFQVPIDLAKLEVEVGDTDKARQDLMKNMEVAVRSSHFDVMWHMRRILEARPRYGSVNRVIEAIAEAKLPRAPVYYSTDRKAIVFRQEWQDNLLGVRPWTAHHLVYASYDQAPGGLITMLADQGQKTDSIRVRQCLLEGQARLVEVATALYADGNTLADVDVDSVLQPPTTFVGGEADTPCEAGVRLLMKAYATNGWENIAASIRSPPESTEQLMHPEKIGVDFPAFVGLPRWPQNAGEGTLIHDDTLGELTIYRLLRERGIEEKEARLAAIGWDGDHLKVFAIPSGARVTVWRTLWDRDLDARQFANAVMPKKHDDPQVFRVVQTGRIVDCVSTSSDALAQIFAERLAAITETPRPEETDVETTKAVEARLYAN